MTNLADRPTGRFFGPATLVELLTHRAACQPDDRAFTFLVDGESEEIHLSYHELDRQARAIAAWLQSRDLAGQRALLLYPPGLDFIAAFFGCLYAGVVAVPLYPPRRNRSIERIEVVAADADARVALTVDRVLSQIEPLAADSPTLGKMAWLATTDMPEAMESQWRRPELSASTLAFLQYTSGSTGTPKGVMLSHGNLIHNSALIATAFEHTRSNSGVFWLPAYHDMGLIGGILQPLYVGRPNVLMSPMNFLMKPYRWLSAISRYGASTSGGPNFAYDLCVRKITPEQRKSLDLSSWRVAFNGAEPVRAETLQAFRETFAPCGFRPEAFYPCYGLAEATLMVSGGLVPKRPRVERFQADSLATGDALACGSEAADARPLVSCGQAMPDQTVAIVDPDTFRKCPEGEVGEIWVAGPSVAQGYWRSDKLTEDTFHARTSDTGEGPFLRTGDLGFLSDGELFATGRIKDLIIIRGMNHYPQDIEHTVQQAHPRLRLGCGAAFVVENQGRQRLIVVQEIERGKAVGLDEVVQASRRRVADEHDLTLDAVLLLRTGSIPKTSSGKVRRHACREGFVEGSLVVVHQWPAAKEDPSDRAPEQAPAADEKTPSVRMPCPLAPVPTEAGRCSGAKRQPAAAFGQLDTDSHPRTASVNPPGRRGCVESVFEEIRRVAKERADGLSLESAIADAGLDSLERIEILAALEERFRVQFPEHEFAALGTVGELVAAVETHLGSKPPEGDARRPSAEELSQTCRVGSFPEYRALRQNLDLLKSLGMGNPFFTPHEGVTNDRTRIDGREVINFSSYNYLGMSGDPAVVEATQQAVARYGTSASASRLVSGEKDLHAELEGAIAAFLGAEAAVVMVGGHATNETVIGHLMGPGDLILHDQLAHNSIVQGAILSGARRRAFPHNDFRAADRFLTEHRHEYRRVLLAIEGVYSMDGDVPELPRFLELKRRHHAMLMVDEAHSIGVLGARGRGVTEHFQVEPGEVDILMGTLSKSLGSGGGYIAGSAVLVEYLKYTAPGFVFSAAIPPPAAAAALASLRLLEKQPQRVARLARNTGFFLSAARDAGIDTGRCRQTPVIPVILGNSVDCLTLSQAMLGRGVNVMPILYPAVEESAARLRFFLTSSHTAAQIRFAVAILAEELSKLNPRYLSRSSTPPTAVA